MRTLRLALPILALAGLVSSGCILTSAQILATYELPNPFTIQDGATFGRVDVDLSTLDSFRSHQDDLKDVVDLALLGRFSNRAGSPALSLSAFITRDLTTFGDAATLVADPRAIRVWGPFSLPAGASATAITWDQSVALFRAGKGPLIDEIKGDGKFSLYLVPSTATFDVKVDNGALVMVLDGGM